jgi:hypothetical protein
VTGVADDSPVWDAYGASLIAGGDGRVWAGEGAITLDGGLTWHVLTAANPDSNIRSIAENAAANARLLDVLRDRGFAPVAVVGSSADGGWRESSWAVGGGDRSALCEIGDAFGQAAIFELDSAELRVLRCPDGAVMRRRSRDVAVPVTPHV